MFAQHVEDFLERGRLVGLLHRGEFAREAARGGFEDLAFGIALLGLVVRAEQVACDLGDQDDFDFSSFPCVKM